MGAASAHGGGSPRRTDRVPAHAVVRTRAYTHGPHLLTGATNIPTPGAPHS